MSVFDGFRREMTTAVRLAGTLAWTRPAARENQVTVADDLEASFTRHARRTALVFLGASWSYAELDARANRMAHWALKQGLSAGDVVALCLDNRPDFLAVWIGLAKVGVVTALINPQLTGRSLTHALETAGARHVITGAAQSPGVLVAREGLPSVPAIWSLDGAEPGVRALEVALAGLPGTRPDPSHRSGLTGASTALLIYTSGTTGLPKAARMTHMRLRHLMRSFIATTGAGPRDRVLNTLPLYHGTGGICAVGVALLTGAALVVSRRFSASRFWQEAVDSRATVFVYVGELCRYLVNQPPGEIETRHTLRCGFGNGLRADVWGQFVARFGIEKIIEFYGATEGNVGLINFDGHPGAVGRVPPWLKGPMSNVRIIRHDPDTGLPVRGPDGLCIEAQDGETGEMIGRIGDEARKRFDGYGDAGETARKVLTGVFAAGDAWFRTGDLMRRDALGYFYFVDRIGDTFRWKGENVSTREVENVLAAFPGIAFANVYGVSVPGAEGRAGMAALCVEGPLDMAALARHLQQNLQPAAIPVYLRLDAGADTTETLKLRKGALQAEGFDPQRTGCPVWIRDAHSGGYSLLVMGDSDAHAA